MNTKIPHIRPDQHRYLISSENIQNYDDCKEDPRNGPALQKWYIYWHMPQQSSKSARPSTHPGPSPCLIFFFFFLEMSQGTLKRKAKSLAVFDGVAGVFESEVDAHIRKSIFPVLPDVE